VHVSPVNSRFHSFQYSFLSLIYSNIDGLLFLRKLSIDWECNSLISTVSIPFASHIVEDHLASLYDFIIFNIMQSGTIPATRTYWIECQLFTSAMNGMLKVKKSMHLYLCESWLARFHNLDMRISCYFTNIFHQFYLILGFNNS